MLYQKIIGLALVSFPIAIGYLFPIESLVTHHPKISRFGKKKYRAKLYPTYPRSDRMQTLAFRPDIESKPIFQKPLPPAGLKKRW